MNNVNEFVCDEKIIVDNEDHKYPNLHIALTIDKAFIKASGILIYSILKNNQNLKINFHIFTTCSDLSLFDNFLSFNTKITLYILNNAYFSTLEAPINFSSAIFYRIAIPNILYKKVDKILYIDSDVLCIGELNLFENLDLNHKYIACVEDSEISSNYKRTIGLDSDFKYFNSGVMFININKWVDEQIFEKFMKKITRQAYEYPDQDVLNILFNENNFYLPRQYNNFREENLNNTILIHYVGWLKPWLIGAYNNHLYLDYYSKSPFKHIPLDKPKNYKFAKKMYRRHWSHNNYYLTIKWYLIYTMMKGKLI